MPDEASTILGVFAGDIAYILMTLILDQFFGVLSSSSLTGPAFDVTSFIGIWWTVGGILSVVTLVSIFSFMNG